MADFLRKREVKSASSQGLPASASVMATTMPALWAHISCGSYPDGSVRQRSTLSVFVGDYGLQACLNDRDNGLVAFVTGDSLVAILDALEASLASDSLDWRVSRQAGGAKGRKK